MEFLAGLDSTIDREALRRRAFAIARASTGLAENHAVIEWLDDVTRALREIASTTAPPTVAQSFFSPGEDCPRAIGRLLDQARHTIDICVFTITDDHLSDAILEAHRRQVAIRIITDDAKAEDLGSDIERFERAGIATRVDRSPSHMHHKFAIFDGSTLLTGSYNWTRGAARDNEENLIITSDARHLVPFEQTYNRLWERLDPAQ